MFLCSVSLPTPNRSSGCPRIYAFGEDSGVRHSVAGIEYESARAATSMDIVSFGDWEKLEPKNWDESGALPLGGTQMDGLSGKHFGLPGFACHYGSRLPETISGEDFTRIIPFILISFTPVRPRSDLSGARCNPLCRGRELARAAFFSACFPNRKR